MFKTVPEDASVKSTTDHGCAALPGPLSYLLAQVLSLSRCTEVPRVASRGPSQLGVTEDGTNVQAGILPYRATTEHRQLKRTDPWPHDLLQRGRLWYAAHSSVQLVDIGYDGSQPHPSLGAENLRVRDLPSHPIEAAT